MGKIKELNESVGDNSKVTAEELDVPCTANMREKFVDDPMVNEALALSDFKIESVPLNVPSLKLRASELIGTLYVSG